MPLRVAIIYNTKEDGEIRESDALSTNGLVAVKDLNAEFDSWETVQRYIDFIEDLGHECVPIHGDEHLLEVRRAFESAKKPIDICWNTCEGFRGFDREAQVPAMLEMHGIPYHFPRPLGMSLTLDKAMTKRVLLYHGLPTPAFQEFFDPEAPLEPCLADKWPLFVKPNSEGTGMGVTAKSLCANEAELREQLRFLIREYGHSALVEEFIPGRELTCGVVGNLAPEKGAGLRVLPIEELNLGETKVGGVQKSKCQEVFGDKCSDDALFYDRGVKCISGENFYEDFKFTCPAKLPKDVEDEVKRLTVEVFRVCVCRDAARVDFRRDTRGGQLKPMILEINAIPGMMNESDLTMEAAAEGFSHKELVQNVFAAGCERYGLDHNLKKRWEANCPPRSRCFYKHN